MRPEGSPKDYYSRGWPSWGAPLGRLTASVDAMGSWDWLGSVGADAGSSVTRASGEAPCGAILTAKASSTSLASCADRRLFAFRIAMARGCRPSAGGFGSLGWVEPWLQQNLR